MMEFAFVALFAAGHLIAPVMLQVWFLAPGDDMIDSRWIFVTAINARTATLGQDGGSIKSASFSAVGIGS
jgi:hypothetical protein